MKKLYDLIGTRYIYGDFASELETILSQEDQVDLAECKFTPETERVLARHYKDTEMINSTNEDWNNIIQYNVRQLNAKEVETTVIPTDYDKIEDIMKSMMAMNASKVYVIDTKYPARYKCIAFMVLVSMTRPEIKFKLTTEASDFFNFVRKSWLASAQPHQHYYMLEHAAVMKVACVNGYVETINGEKIREEEFVRDYMAIPSDFGEIVTYENEEYEGVKAECLNTLTMSKRSKRKMLNYI